MPPSRFIQENFLPIGPRLIDLGASMYRWLRIWTHHLDVSGTATFTGTVTVPTPVNNTDAATKVYVDAIPSIDVEEVDGSPAIANATTLRFDQGDGFVVTNPSGAIARVDLAAVPNTVLANSSLTVTAGTGLSDGCVVSLWGTVTLSLTTPVTIATGGTAATTAADARTNLGLGSIATQSSASVAITGGTVTGITDLAVADGGTGLSSGTSGGILGYTAAGTLASSALLTANGLLRGGGAGATPVALAAATNGQLPIGNTGNPPTLATIGAGENIIVTSGAGSISVATAAFQKGVVRDANTFSTTSAANVDVTNLSITFTTGARRVLLMGSFRCAFDTTAVEGTIAIDIDGTDTDVAFFRAQTSTSERNAVTFHYVTDALTAASHTFKVNIRSNGTASFSLQGATIANFFSAIELP